MCSEQPFGALEASPGIYCFSAEQSPCSLSRKATTGFWLVARACQYVRVCVHAEEMWLCPGSLGTFKSAVWISEVTLLETRQRPGFLCVDKSWHCLPSSPEKERLCMSEQGVVTMSLKGRQRLCFSQHH